MSKFNRYTVTVDVDLDYELDDNDVLEMAKERGLLAAGRLPEAIEAEQWDVMERDVRAAFAHRDARHFEIVLGRMRASAAVPEPPGAPPLFDDEAPRSKPAGRH
jgi:hypothetical protein